MLCAGGMILVMLVASSCATFVQGEAQAPPGRCLHQGYEDLPAISSDCGVSVPVTGLARGYTARSVRLDGHEVLYFITSQSFGNDMVVPRLNEDSNVVHPYAHAAVQGVQRMPLVDVVQIVASKDCPVEKLYDHPLLQLDCHDEGPLLGWRLTSEGAATVLSQPMVNDIKATAHRANDRTVYYELSIVRQRVS